MINSMWHREHSWKLWQIMWLLSAPVQKNLPETEEVSRQSSINCVAWFLMVTLMQISNEMKQAE